MARKLDAKTANPKTTQLAIALLTHLHDTQHTRVNNAGKRVWELELGNCWLIAGAPTKAPTGEVFAENTSAEVKTPAKAAKAKAKAKAQAGERLAKAYTGAVNRGRYAAARVTGQVAATLGPQKAWQKGTLTTNDIAYITAAGLDATPALVWAAAKAQDAPKPKRKAKAKTTA